MDPSCRYFLILRTRWALGSNKPCVSLLCALTSLEIAYSLSNSRQASVVSAKLRLLPCFPLQSYRVYYTALNSSCSIYRHFHIQPECFSISNFSLSLSSRVFSLFALRKIPVPFHRLRLIFDLMDYEKTVSPVFNIPLFPAWEKIPFFRRENSNAWFFDRESSK